eukprot:TRINITY_DN3215_c0_g2_i5.p1 TRINITY_DN3215_c0_g2~~TRINITY_DN3215_c0_g2_i5.p1  ORF type:complete len:356 (+),score=77.06 TRINITY_DN3215_c0_g2_i5:77-1144(+)
MCIRDRFWEDGWVLKRLFEPEDLQPSIDAINLLVDDLAQRLYEAGKISDTYQDEGFEKRLISLERACPNVSVWLHKQPFKMPKEFQELWSHPKLLDCAEQLIGGNIAGHPVWNLRTKVPSFKQATVPWHQDTAYLSEDSWSVLQPAAWIPMVDTNETNGCLRVVSGGHRSGRTAVHTNCWADTWYIELDPEVAEQTLGCDMRPAEEGGDVVTVPVPKGSVLLFNNLIPHQSLENHSDQIRWSFDLRWQNPAHGSGFDGKPPIIMRDPAQPDMLPDWESWANINPFSLRGSSVSEDEISDTVVTGPWMSMWEITHKNRHTDAHNPDLYDPARWSTRTMADAERTEHTRNSTWPPAK